MGGGTWRKRNFALFLLHLTKISINSYLYSKEKQMASFNILLQTLIVEKETAHHFYSHLGFTDCGDISERPAMEHKLGPELTAALLECKDSNTNFVHLICDKQDVNVFCNNTGTFGDVHSYYRRVPCHYSNYDTSKNNPLMIYFPFKVKREHTLVLAAGLDLFYLPYIDTAVMDDYICPTSAVNDQTSVYLCQDHHLKMANPQGWLNDVHINFVGKW